MTSQAEVAKIVQLGRDIAFSELLEVALGALVVYDYFLTLEDEIRYAWKTENVLILVLFLFIRYLPIGFKVWNLIALMYPGYLETYACIKTAFRILVYYAFMAAFCQIVLTQRTYAVTGKKKWIAGILYTICTLQFGVGVYMFVWAARNPVVGMPVIPMTYHLCPPNIQQIFALTQMSLSLAFDIAVFVFVLAAIRRFKWQRGGVGVPNIIDTINRDAKIYFGIITTNHVLIVIMYASTRPAIRGFPIMANFVLVPMMLSRMTMSLKKAASSQQSHISLDIPATGISRDTTSNSEVLRLSPLKKC